MHRREFFKVSAALLPVAVVASDRQPPPVRAEAKLTRPTGEIRVAFLVSQGSNVIDMAGPWEVFQDTMTSDDGMPRPFRLFTVSDGKSATRLTGGLHVIPDFDLADAPTPHVVVVPAMRGTPRVHEWLRSATKSTQLTMSVCTGAFQLARAGLLKGLAATTHHEYYDAFAREFPDVQLKRGLRFVEGAPNIATAGGLTSGVDLALRTVDRYFGRSVAQRTAEYMEYSSVGWTVAPG